MNPDAPVFVPGNMAHVPVNEDGQDRADYKYEEGQVEEGHQGDGDQPQPQEPQAFEEPVLGGPVEGSFDSGTPGGSFDYSYAPWSEPGTDRGFYDEVEEPQPTTPVSYVRNGVTYYVQPPPPLDPREGIEYHGTRYYNVGNPDYFSYGEPVSTGPSFYDGGFAGGGYCGEGTEAEETFGFYDENGYYVDTSMSELNPDAAPFKLDVPETQEELKEVERAAASGDEGVHFLPGPMPTNQLHIQETQLDANTRMIQATRQTVLNFGYGPVGYTVAQQTLLTSTAPNGVQTRTTGITNFIAWAPPMPPMPYCPRPYPTGFGPPPVPPVNIWAASVGNTTSSIPGIPTTTYSGGPARWFAFPQGFANAQPPTWPYGFPRGGQPAPAPGPVSPNPPTPTPTRVRRTKPSRQQETQTEPEPELEQEQEQVQEEQQETQAPRNEETSETETTAPGDAEGDVDYRLWLGNPSTESDRVPWYEEMEIDERDADQ